MSFFSLSSYLVYHNKIEAKRKKKKASKLKRKEDSDLLANLPHLYKKVGEKEKEKVKKKKETF